MYIKYLEYLAEIGWEDNEVITKYKQRLDVYPKSLIERGLKAFTQTKHYKDGEVVFKEGLPLFIYEVQKLLGKYATSQEKEDFLSLIATIVRGKDFFLKEKRNQRERMHRRNQHGLTVREQQKQDTIKKISELKQQGFKQIEVARQLDLNKSTVSRYWNVP